MMDDRPRVSTDAFTVVPQALCRDIVLVNRNTHRDEEGGRRPYCVTYFSFSLSLALEIALLALSSRRRRGSSTTALDHQEYRGSKEFSWCGAMMS